MYNTGPPYIMEGIGKNIAVNLVDDIKTISPTSFLGSYVHIEFSCHTTKGTIVSLGVNWILLDTGSMIYTPCITNITTDIPKEETRTMKTTIIPTNLGDLFR